jgi:hypothetical protein
MKQARRRSGIGGRAWSAAVLALAACAPTPPVPGPASLPVDPPPLSLEAFTRERPVYHVPEGTGDAFVYVFPQGPYVMMVEPGVGRRHARPDEAQRALERYAALHTLSPQAQDAVALQLHRAEKAARGDIDTELLERMDRTIARWREEQRALLIKQEAARAAKLPREAARVEPIIADYEWRIQAHELRKRLYTSPEWKARRSPPSGGVTIPDRGAGR